MPSPHAIKSFFQMDWTELFTKDVGFLIQQILSRQRIRAGLNLYSTCRILYHSVARVRFLADKTMIFDPNQDQRLPCTNIIVRGTDLHKITVYQHIRGLFVDGLDEQTERIPLSLEPLGKFQNLIRLDLVQCSILNPNALLHSNISSLSITRSVFQNPLHIPLLSVKDLVVKETQLLDFRCFPSLLRLCLQIGGIVHSVTMTGLDHLKSIKMVGNYILQPFSCPKLVTFDIDGVVHFEQIQDLMHSVDLNSLRITPISIIILEKLSQFVHLTDLVLAFPYPVDVPTMGTFSSLLRVKLTGLVTNVHLFLTLHPQLEEFELETNESIEIPELCYNQASKLRKFVVHKLANSNIDFVTLFPLLQVMEIGGKSISSLKGINFLLNLQALTLVDLSLPDIILAPKLTRLELHNVKLECFDALIGSKVKYIFIQECTIMRYNALFLLKPWVHFVVSNSHFHDILVNSHDKMQLRDFLKTHPALIE
jgi:hypothetical protein